MDWTAIVLAVIGPLLGGSTIFASIAYYKSNKRLKELEVRDKETDLANRRIDALHEDLDVLNGQLKDVLRAGAHKDEIIEDKTKQIRLLNEQRLDEQMQWQREKAEMELQHMRSDMLKDRHIDWLKLWLCRRVMGNPDVDPETCARREPQQPYPITFVLPPGLDLSPRRPVIVTDVNVARDAQNEHNI